MKKEIRYSLAAVEDQLHKLHMESISGRCEKNYYSISWYISTGRSSIDWETAFLRANPQKLMERIARNSGSCDQEIEAATAYLRRYCGLRDC